MAWIANPIGDFPLNDDWVYGVSVKALVENGQVYFLTEWACKTLVAHVLWGALFCLPFGFSYTALHISQLAAGILGVLGVYWLCLELGASRRTSLICALTLLVNPLYFQLSNSFMTDVAFVAFCALGLLLLTKGIVRTQSFYSVFGWIVVGIAIWVRELSLMIPAGYAVFQVYRSGFGLKSLYRAARPAIIFIALLIVHQFVMVPLFGFPNLNNPRTTSALKHLIKDPLQFVFDTTSRTAILLMYAGLFALPMLIWFRISLKKFLTALERKVMNYTVGAFLALSGVTMIAMGRLMPLGRNSLFDFGLGPATLRDVYLLKLPNLPTAPTWFWAIVTAASVWGGAQVLKYVVLAIMRIWERDATKRQDTTRGLLIFFLSMSLLYAAVVIASMYYDRYLTIYLPLVAALCVLLGGELATVSRVRYAGTVAVLSLYGLFGTLATHDYMSWNRVKWEVVRDLNGPMNIPPNKIDAGYEVNVTLLFDIGKSTDPNKSWWWVDDDEYIVAFGPIPGYEIIERRPFPNYLYRDDTAICVLKRL